VILPAGFRASGVACGLKQSGRLDLGLLVSDGPAKVAGVFTTNRVQAAPLVLTRRRVRSGVTRGLVVNAGNANACTGSRGAEDARAMARIAARAVGVRAPEMLVASTGVIGEFLDMRAVENGIGAAARKLSPSGVADLRAAIMTTDTRPKSAAVNVGGALVAGIAKGAGMMAPEMATMLCFVTTDLAVEQRFLREALRLAVHGSFNAIDLDGCRSTNDCVLALANGSAGGPEIAGADRRSAQFADALSEVCGSLARQIAEDGEGLTKLVTLRVQGARTEKEARAAAGSIASSILFRCALNGSDPNWGRVLAALGTSGIAFDPSRVDVWLGGEKMCEAGAPGLGNRARARAALLAREVEVRVDLHRGEASSTVLTNDLSAEYVRINSEYTT